MLAPAPQASKTAQGEGEPDLLKSDWKKWLHVRAKDGGLLGCYLTVKSITASVEFSFASSLLSPPLKNRGALNMRGREDLRAADATMDERVRCIFATEVNRKTRGWCS